MWGLPRKAATSWPTIPNERHIRSPSTSPCLDARHVSWVPPRAVGVGDWWLHRGELRGELGDDAGAEEIRHAQDLEVNALVVGDIGREVAVESIHRLLQCEVEMRLHHRLDLVERPVLRVGGIEERGDLVCVGIPGGAG